MTKKSKSSTKPASNLVSLSISTALDQPRNIPNLGQTLYQIDQILFDAVSQDRPDMAFSLLSSLSQMNQVSGIGLAKALWTIKQQWKKLGRGRGEFEEEMFRHLGKAPDTIRRYVLVWEMFSWIDSVLDKKTRERFQSRPIADLIAIAQAMSQYGIFQPEVLEELSQMPDQTSLRKKLREVTGREEISSGLQLRLLGDGTLEAWEAGEVSVIGFIRNSEDDMRDPIRSKAVNRILKGAGIHEHWQKIEW